MKILHTEAALGWAGQGIRVLNEVKGMREIGYDVQICCDPVSELYKKCLEHGLPVHSLPMRFRNPFVSIRLRRWLTRNQFDIINVHSSIDHWIVAVAIIGMRDRPVLVRTRHVSSPLNRSKLTRWLYCKATDFVITAGQKLLDDLVESGNLPREKMTSIPTGSDENRYTPSTNVERSKASLGLLGDKIVVGMVAKMRPWKGHLDLVRSIHDAGLAGEIHLLMVGDGKTMQEIANAVAEFNINCQFVGEVDDVVPYFQAMDIYCLPSKGVEGVPQAMTQAMLCGIPVIAADVGSVAEFVKTGVNGLLYPAGNRQELEKSLTELVRSHALRCSLGQKARAVALEMASFQLMIERTEKLMKYLFELKSRRALAAGESGPVG